MRQLLILNILKIIVSFFVQNCEVFHEITE